MSRKSVVGGFEIAVVEVGEAGLFADEPAADRAAGDENGSGGAVVGALVGVGGDPATELGVGRGLHSRGCNPKRLTGSPL